MKIRRAVLILIFAVASLGLSTLPAFAACNPASGTGGNDNITCNGANPIDTSISGLAGNDTITVSSGGGGIGDRVYGDNTTTFGDDSIVVDSVLTEVRGDTNTGGTNNPNHVGGNDTIILQDDADVNRVYGDNLFQRGGSTPPVGGNDSIVLEVGSEVDDSVYGDNMGAGSGGSTGGKGGNDEILVQGWVKNSVLGDDVSGSTSADGGDDFIMVYNGGVVDVAVYGDRVQDDGGDDSIWIHSTVNGDIFGDYMSGGNCCATNGGNDSIFVGGSAYVGGDIHGDFMLSSNVPGRGGDDTIYIASGGLVDGNIIGDNLKNKDSLGGKDSITIRGSVKGYVAGDNDVFDARSGRDTIIVGHSGRVYGSVSGDRTKKAGSKDTITISGTVDQSVFGDNTNRGSGADKITVGGTGLVKKNVIGDQGKTIAGGDDVIKINGTVNKNVVGDGFRTTVKPDVDGGDDTITVTDGGLVKGDVIGDDAPDKGGRDSIVIEGTVNGNVIGDQVGGKGGIDTIKVRSTGWVKGDVVGDDAGTPANGGNGGDDLFVINGIVDGTVWLDNVGGPSLDVTGDVSAVDLAIGGDDVIVVAGQITGNISSAAGSDGDDVFVVADGGVVGGVMDAGAHVDGDSLVFDLSTKSKGEFGKLSELFKDLTIEEGGVSYRGNTYRWVNFEFLQYAIQLFQTRTLPLYCSGIYEKNADGTACVRKGQEETDAILFHRNNPGYDGRLPGTESCAIYNYGNAMRVYEVVDGSEGELVTTISADVFSHNIESNLLLASSASGNVNVYYLTSNEVQVECTDWTGKTEVRIIPDFSGTVNASFDKDA